MITNDKETLITLSLTVALFGITSPKPMVLSEMKEK